MGHNCYELCCDDEFFECLAKANPNNYVDLAVCEDIYCDIICLAKCKEKGG